MIAYIKALLWWNDDLFKFLLGYHIKSKVLDNLICKKLSINFLLLYLENFGYFVLTYYQSMISTLDGYQNQSFYNIVFIKIN